MKVLITADWHIRGERPLCRLDDDWIESQRKIVSEIRSKFIENGCDHIWILGDLFDAPRCSTEAVNMLISELQKFPAGSVRVLCGNHDLKDHNYENLELCSIGTIKKLYMDIPLVVKGGAEKNEEFKISAKPFALDEAEPEAQIVCTHQLTFPSEKVRPMPDCGVLAQDLLDKWGNAQIIFTGDYHHGYIYKENRNDLSPRYVVTPGCIDIQKADELDYRPSIVIWDTFGCNDSQFEQIYLDPQIENCTRDHIEAREQNESMLSEVVETIKGGTEITLDFDSNLEKQVKKTTPAIIECYEILSQELNGEK